MAHNFRSEKWKGSLEELFEECFGQGPAPEQILKFSQFVLDGIKRENEIFPLRKHKQHPQRGKTFEVEGRRFIPVDNEPLIGLMNLALSDHHQAVSFMELFGRNKLKASWKFEVKSDPLSSGFKTGGVAADFRRNGLKVAHIEDAAEHIGHSDTEYIVRYLRSMMMANVFLFPSPRCCRVEVSAGGLVEGATSGDWSENKMIRSLAFEFLSFKLDEEDKKQFRSSLDPKITQSSNFREQIRNINVTVTPKHGEDRSSTMRTKIQADKTALPPVSGVIRTISKKEAKENGFENVIKELKEFRIQFPDAVTFSEDRSKNSDPSPWVHVDFGDFFKDGDDDFTTSKTKVRFKGSEYNGIHNFHGDTKWKKIDEFLEVLEIAEEGIRDVLVPSATFEFDTLPKGKIQKPKLALNGFNGVDGFFLYKD